MTSRTRDPQARIAAIRDAAAEILVESGPEALTHRAVAAQANVAVGTTTKYFATKDDLRRSALERLWEETEQELQEIADILNHTDQPIQALARLIHHHLTDSRLLRMECALICNGLLYEDLRQISMRWYAGFTDILNEHYSDIESSTLSFWFDGATLHTALTGNAPEEHRVLASIKNILKEQP